MKKIIRIVLISANLFASLVLFFSLVIPNFKPLTIWPLPLLGLAFPYLVFLQIGFLIFWLSIWSRWTFIPILSLLLSYASIANFFAFNLSSGESEAITVYSHNLRSFGLYGPKFETETGSKIFAFYKKQKPDIAAFQEFFHSDRKKIWNFSPLDSLVNILELPNQHIEYSVYFSLNYFGLAIFSRYPIVNKGAIHFDNTRGTNFCIYADIEIDQQIVRVYNFHLASIHLADEDYEFIKHFAERDQNSQIKGSTKLVNRLKSGYQRRTSQVETILAHIESCPHPIIVCGDFNDTPQSYAYKAFRENLSDSFIEQGFGIGATYNGPIPFNRIDYILHSNQIECTDFKLYREDITDHFPMAASLNLSSAN